jgi:hypothetical protein
MKQQLPRRREDFHSSREHVECQPKREKTFGVFWRWEFLLTLSNSHLYLLAVFTIHRDRPCGCHFEANSYEANVSAKPQKASQ